MVPQIAPVVPRRLDFAREGQRLLVQEDGGLVSLWDVSASGGPQMLASMAAFAIDARFTPDGHGVISAGWDGRVRGWTEEGRLLWISPERHNGRIRSLAVGADVIATGGEDGTIRFWQRDGAALGAPFAAHEIAVMSLAITPQGDIVSMGGDESIRLWRRTHTQPPRFTGSVLYQDPVRQFQAALPNMLQRDPLWGWDRAVAVSPNGAVIAGAVLDGVVRLWNVDGSPRATLDGHGKRHVRAVAFSPRGDLLATAGWDGRVQLWNLDGSRHGEGFATHAGPVFGLAFSPQGDCVATSGKDNRLRLWNPEGTARSEFPSGDAEQVLAVAFAPKEPLVAVAYRSGVQGAVRLWSLTGEARMSVRPVHDFPVESLAFSPRGDLFVTGDRNGIVQPWKLDGSEFRGPWRGHHREVTAVAVSPQGEIIASGARHEPLLVWDLYGHRRGFLTGVGDSMSLIAFSPQGGLIAAAGVPGNVQIWDTTGHVRTPPFKVHQEFIHALAFAPSGNNFATSGGGSSAIKLWNVDGSPHGAALEGATGVVRSLAFATEDLLVSGGDDGVVRLWNIPGGTVERLEIGVAVDQLGFWRDLLWVRANHESLLFFNRARELVATAHLRRDGFLAFTPDGWFTSTGNNARGVHAFRDGNGPLSVADTLPHLASSKVLAALTDTAKGPEIGRDAPR